MTTTATITSAKEEQSSHVFYRSLHPDDKPPVVVSGKGIEFLLDDGSTVIDACGGAAVAAIGMGHPKVVEAMQKQAAQMAFAYSAVFTHEPAERLARFLFDHSEDAFSKVCFCSGGSEAMETAIKLARQYWFEKERSSLSGTTKRTNFIARRMSYHGTSLGCLALGYHPVRRAPFEQILAQHSFHHVSPAYSYRYGNNESDEQYTERLRKELDDMFQKLGGDTVAAFALETVVGATSGVTICPKGYIKACREVCDKYGALLILDEVMSGMGRMGTLHAWQSIGEGTKPDIQAIAKGLGGGYQPIGAVLVSPRVANGIKAGSGSFIHGFTYQAHPMVCATALAVQTVIQEEKLLDRAMQIGHELKSLLEKHFAENATVRAMVGEVRGQGCLWCIELVKDKTTKEPYSATLRPRLAQRIVYACFKQEQLSIMGFSGGIDGTNGDHIILAPAYNTTPDQVEVIAERVVRAMEAVAIALQSQS